MAEITVNWYYSGNDTPTGTVKITPRGNGYEWTKTSGNGGDIAIVYCPTFNLKELSVILNVREPWRKTELGTSYFTNILINPVDHKPIYFTKSDALKLYGFFAEQMEWSPDALASGTAHPDLLAAQARHSAGRGGSRKARRTRRRARRL